jgi:two-component system cell cycle sensor histidine kinase/response regulator CckA
MPAHVPTVNPAPGDQLDTPGQVNDQKTILVVDDDGTVLRFVSELLTDAGYHVLVATSGEAALQVANTFSSPIHLLLTDFQMPGMSGIELATKLTTQRPQIKVLLMSGFTDGMLVLNDGWHFLSKPFIPSQLLTLISGLISPPTGSRFSTSSA